MILTAAKGILKEFGKQMKPKTIGTHSGSFHADEVVGTTLLLNFTEEFKGAQLVRTRDMEILNQLDLILDVGDVYDPSRHRYDHHQKGFNEVMPGFNTRLSAAGLIYKHFGNEIISKGIDYLFGEGKVINPEYRVALTPEDQQFLYNRLYADFFEFLDANDNGISMLPPDVKPRYKQMTNHLVGRIGRLNNDLFKVEQLTKEEMFRKGMEIARQDFLDDLEYLYTDLFLGIPIVEKAILKRFETHPSGRILLLEKPCTWKSAIFKLEKKYGMEGQIIFVVYPDTSSGTYRVQTVGLNAYNPGFENRGPLKKEFWATRDQQLQEMSGVADAIFVHHSGFIGGAQSFEGALKLGDISLASII